MARALRTSGRLLGLVAVVPEEGAQRRLVGPQRGPLAVAADIEGVHHRLGVEDLAVGLELERLVRIRPAEVVETQRVAVLMDGDGLDVYRRGEVEVDRVGRGPRVALVVV